MSARGTLGLIAIVAATTAWAPAVGGTPATGIDGQALLRQIDRRLNPASYEAYKQIINIEPNGRRREYLLYTINDGQDKVAALFVSPASDRGRSTLRLGENMWLYVPNAGRPVRITTLQSVVGGVFNNSDILRLDYAAEYGVTAVETDGPSTVLRLKATSKAVAYDRLTIWADAAKALPTRIECLTEAGLLIKTLHFKEVKDFGGGIVRPAVVETDSPLYKGHVSQMVFAQIRARTFEDEVFTLAFMPSLESLR